MYVYARIGPWCHGEVRNGGLPDWLLKQSKVIRRDDPTFLGYTRTWYSELHKQLEGLLYKDGGPVIGIQLDNETGNNPRYLGALKNLAVELGFDVPLYSYTGWNRSRGPADVMMPMYGGYPDGFWLTEPGISKSGRRQYVFTHILDDANITEHLTGRPGSLTLSGESRYPYLTCEIGGGMAIAYARRPLMTADDIATLPLVKIGSGANAPGYYMYHGGGDLIGKTLDAAGIAGDEISQRSADHQLRFSGADRAVRADPGFVSRPAALAHVPGGFRVATGADAIVFARDDARIAFGRSDAALGGALGWTFGVHLHQQLSARDANAGSCRMRNLR